ncbi:MAG: hypothetical protein P8J91_06745 [Pirellulaceae bacterium]|nr:hypothetical protein [Pirellulaceae bacterium]MDG2103432.1 hypothetical protein [Pirellulaceae bacterium]
MKKRPVFFIVLVGICLGLGAAIVFFQPPQMVGDESNLVPPVSSAPAIDVSKIYGKIQIVKSFPDYKVQVVDSFPDLRVQVVTSFPNKAGKWQMVKSFPDFKIQLVDSFPDFKIKYVSSFPGKE